MFCTSIDVMWPADPWYRVLQSSCNERSKPEMTGPIKCMGSHVRFIIANFDWPTFYFHFDHALQELCKTLYSALQVHIPCGFVSKLHITTSGLSVFTTQHVVYMVHMYIVYITCLFSECLFSSDNLLQSAVYTGFCRILATSDQNQK